MHKEFLPVFGSGLLVFLLIISAGCTGSAPKSTYSVSSDGVLAVTCPTVAMDEQLLFANDTYTKSRIVMHTPTGDVVSYLGTPKQPKALLVYAPGAGEKLAGHEERMVRFAAAGFAFLFVDTRGNGAETAGSRFDPQADYAAFRNGDWPVFYQTVCDLSSARKNLSSRFDAPVYAIGGSNGGRYAAVVAGTDPLFAGYIGISTADWGILASAEQQGAPADVIRFAKSVEPSTYLPRLSPRVVWMFHSRADPIIPFDQGQALFDTAREP